MTLMKCRAEPGPKKSLISSKEHCLPALPSQSPPSSGHTDNGSSPHPTLVHSVATQYPFWWDKEAEPGQAWGVREGTSNTLSLIWQGGLWADTPNTRPNPILCLPPLRLRSHPHSQTPCSWGHVTWIWPRSVGKSAGKVLGKVSPF